jgi:hypothetical protein
MPPAGPARPHPDHIGGSGLFDGMVATTGLDTRLASGAVAVIRPPSPAEDEGYESEADYYPKVTPPTLDTSTRSPVGTAVPLPTTCGAATAFVTTTQAHGLQWYVITGGPHQGAYSTHDYDRDIRPLAEAQPDARSIQASGRACVRTVKHCSTVPHGTPLP